MSDPNAPDSVAAQKLRDAAQPAPVQPAAGLHQRMYETNADVPLMTREALEHDLIRLRAELAQARGELTIARIGNQQTRELLKSANGHIVELRAQLAAAEQATLKALDAEREFIARIVGLRVMGKGYALWIRQRIGKRSAEE